MANERGQNHLNPAAADDDDDFDFGGFEAADPEPAGQGHQAEAQASPWAAFAIGGAPERPDLLCAQNRFPPYLDPSDISGASADMRSMAASNTTVNVAPLPSVAADLLGNAQFAEARHPEVHDQGENRLNGRLPDLGLGINDNPLFAQPVANHQAPVAAALAAPPPQLQQQQPPQQQQQRIADVSAANGAAIPHQPPLQEVANHVEQNIDVAAAVQNVQEEEASGELPRDQQEQQQQQQQSVQEALGQDRNVDVEERQELTQRLETLVERNRVLEEELERSQSDLAAQRSRIHEIEARHSETLDGVRRAGQEALSVVVEEYKEQLKTVLMEQQEASQRQMLETLKEQTTSFQELLDQQKQKQEEERAEDKEEVKRNVQKALEDTRTEVQGQFQVFLQEEKEKWKKELEKAVQEERAASQVEIQRVVREEQASARDRLDEARAEYSMKLEEERKRQEEALVVVRQEEAEKARDHMASLVTEERERGRESVREALEAARADTRSYIDEQRRRDSTIRQRHFASLDLFLESCRQQVSFLMNHEQDNDGAILQLPQAANVQNHDQQHPRQNDNRNSNEDLNKETGDS